MKKILETIYNLLVLGVTEVYVVSFNLIVLHLITTILNKHKMKSKFKLKQKKYHEIQFDSTQKLYFILLLSMLAIIILGKA